MQARETNSHTQITCSSWPRLPFTLVPADVSADPLHLALTTRLDALQQLVAETRNELELLRYESARTADMLTLGRPSASGSNEARTPVPTADADWTLRRSAPTGEKHGLRIHLLGTFEVCAGGKAVTSWPSRKSRLLLAYLTTERNRLVPKEVLVELFWPEFSLSRGPNNLSIAIHQVRTTLKELMPGGSRVVRVEQGLYGLDQTLIGWVDLNEFRQRLSDARQALQRRDKGVARQCFLAAVDLYRGDFLESDLYEEWTVELRRSNSAAFARALAWLAGDAAESKDWERVLDHAGEIVRREPCDEEGHRWLMTAYWQLGKRARALQQYRLCSERLLEDLGASPSEETQRLFFDFGG